MTTRPSRVACSPYATGLREDGMSVVQAPEVDADTLGGLPNVLPGERAVDIDPQVILAAAAEIRKRGLA